MEGIKEKLPEVDHLTKPFWDAAKEHKLVLQKCARCGAFQWYPKPLCEECGYNILVWTEVNGKGTIYSFTVIYHAKMNPAFEKDTPYNIVIVELDEGPRMYSNLIDCPPQDLKIGMRVEVVFQEKDGFYLPKFRQIQT